MLETRACTNTRYMVQREPRFEHDSNVSVLSSDDESTPSETTLDEICELSKGSTQDLLDFTLTQEGRYPPTWFDRIGDVEHNSPPVRFGDAKGEFEGVVGGVVGRGFVPVDVKMLAERFHTMTLRGDRFHIGTLHCAEAR